MSLLSNISKIMSLLLLENVDFKYILLIFILVYIYYNHKTLPMDIEKWTSMLFYTKQKESDEEEEIDEESPNSSEDFLHLSEEKKDDELSNEDVIKNIEKYVEKSVEKSVDKAKNEFIPSQKSPFIKKAFSLVNPKCKDMKNNPYPNKIEHLKKKYNNLDENNEYTFKINESTCTLPFFHLRKYNDCSFFYNFRIADFGPDKISNLIMCRDIYKWMSTSSLSYDDLPDNYYPIYMILKVDHVISIYEYLKFFVRTKENGSRIAFVQKGNHYLEIQKYIAELIERDVIMDLLGGIEYITYKLDSSENVSTFLDRLISILTVSEKSIGTDITIDYEIIHENKRAFKYFFNSMSNHEVSLNQFSTTI